MASVQCATERHSFYGHCFGVITNLRQKNGPVHNGNRAGDVD
jgi:hypothetical protein